MNEKKSITVYEIKLALLLRNCLQRKLIASIYLHENKN